MRWFFGWNVAAGHSSPIVAGWLRLREMRQYTTTLNNGDASDPSCQIVWNLIKRHNINVCRIRHALVLHSSQLGLQTQVIYWLNNVTYINCFHIKRFCQTVRFIILTGWYGVYCGQTACWTVVCRPRIQAVSTNYSLHRSTHSVQHS